MPDIQWTTEGILSGLYAVVAAMLIIVLYHVLFIVVDLRRVVRRAENITRELQAVIMKPLAVTDEILEWVLHMVQNKGKNLEKKADFKKRTV